jgi:hypothetical protein
MTNPAKEVNLHPGTPQPRIVLAHPAQYLVEVLPDRGATQNARHASRARLQRLHISLNEKYRGWYQSTGTGVTLVTGGALCRLQVTSPFT